MTMTLAVIFIASIHLFFLVLNTLYWKRECRALEKRHQQRLAEVEQQRDNAMLLLCRGTRNTAEALMTDLKREVRR